MAISHPSKIPFAQDGRCKSGLRKNHDTSSRLNQMSARTRPNDEKERILNTPV
jgi:hypothetical protein